jgi:hypothetical protein
MVPTCGCRTALTPRAAGEPVEVGEQRLPARLVQVGPGVVAVPAGGSGQHQDAGVRRVVPVEQPLDLRRRVVSGLVQHHRGEAADRGQVMGGEEPCHQRRVGGQEAVRPELGGGQPHLLHFGQDPVGRELVAPAGHFAHPPGDGRAGDLVCRTAHQEHGVDTTA